MSDYAVFFAYNNDKNVFRLPVNPEQIEVSRTQTIEKYEILKLGQISIPAGLELKQYSFECELPIKHEEIVPNYVETKSNFQEPDYYLQRFEFWRNKKTPFRFIAGRCYLPNRNGMEDDSINDLVLIEELSVSEKAGEEGDKYVSFKLLEYREYGKKYLVEKTADDTKAVKKQAQTEKSNPKQPGYYVVRSGDCLWSIAKKFYGDGSKYTIIYNANKDKIKNPSLIMPGWKLKIPDDSEIPKFTKEIPRMKTEKADKAGANKKFSSSHDGQSGSSIMKSLTGSSGKSSD